jgi:ketosteroid isomerase-like protein
MLQTRKLRRVRGSHGANAIIPAMATSNIEIVRTGLDAYKRGDIDAVLALLDPDVQFEGLHGDACTNREQTGEALRRGTGQAEQLELADAVPFGTDKVMVCLVRLGADEDDEGEGGMPARFYVVVGFAGETIVRMQTFGGRRDAVQAARGVASPAPAKKPAVAADARQGNGGKSKKSLWRRARMGVGRALGR